MTQSVRLFFILITLCSCVRRPMPVVDDAQPSVVVSQRELRMTFPRQPTGPFTFKRDPYGVAPASWAISAPDTPGPLWVFADVWTQNIPGTGDSITIPTLERLARLGAVRSCGPMVHSGPCRNVGSMRASNGRLTIIVNDRAVIQRMFGLRPRSVGAMWRTHPDSNRRMDVPVTYTDPQIPEPNSAMIAQRKRDIAEHERSIRWVSRSIQLAVSPDASHMSAWLHTGDSVRVTLSQVEGVHDVGSVETVRHQNWSIDDSSVAVVRHVRPALEMNPALAFAFPEVSPFWVVARAPGRTILRARDIEPYTGPEPKTMPPTSMERAIVVIPPLGSLRIMPIRDTVGPDERARLRVEARDRAGVLVPGVVVVVKSQREIMYAADSSLVAAHPPGRHLYFVEFRGLRDSTWITRLAK